MKRTFCCSLFLLASEIVLAQVASFDTSNSNLTLPSIEVSGLTYRNVVIRLDSFAVVSVGPQAVTCTSQHLNSAKYSALQLGMSLSQVNAIIGCDDDPSQRTVAGGVSKYTWTTSAPYSFLTIGFNVYGVSSFNRYGF